MVTLAMKGDELSHSTETQRTRFLDVEPFQEVSTARVSYTAKFDGREYPVPNSSAKIKLKRINATSFERVATTGTRVRDGDVDAVRRWKDAHRDDQGRRRRRNAYTSTQVYDKQ
jgi:hypothetical protein